MVSNLDLRFIDERIRIVGVENGGAGKPVDIHCTEDHVVGFGRRQKGTGRLEVFVTECNSGSVEKNRVH
jgi:hypothetical protein